MNVIGVVLSAGLLLVVGAQRGPSRNIGNYCEREDGLCRGGTVCVPVYEVDGNRCSLQDLDSCFRCVAPTQDICESVDNLCRDSADCLSLDAPGCSPDNLRGCYACKPRRSESLNICRLTDNHVCGNDICNPTMDRDNCTAETPENCFECVQHPCNTEVCGDDECVPLQRTQQGRCTSDDLENCYECRTAVEQDVCGLSNSSQLCAEDESCRSTPNNRGCSHDHLSACFRCVEQREIDNTTTVDDSTVLTTLPAAPTPRTKSQQVETTPPSTTSIMQEGSTAGLCGGCSSEEYCIVLSHDECEGVGTPPPGESHVPCMMCANKTLYQSFSFIVDYDYDLLGDNVALFRERLQVVVQQILSTTW